MDKAIDIMKAAMEKEEKMKDLKKKSMDEVIDEECNVSEEQNDNETEEVINEGDNDFESDASEEALKDINGGEEAGDVEASEGKGSKSGKSLFKGKNKEIAAKDQKIADLTDRLMRSMAEFDNFRKRSEKEKSQMFDMGVKSVIEKLLPIIDNFERGLGTFTSNDKDSAFIQGFEMIYKQLMTMMEEIGVKPIEAVGKEFDPNFHNAVMHGEDEAMEENIISEEFQRGYIYRDIVIRHSMVKVVN